MARILIIDDDGEVRTLLRTIIEIDGHEAAEAGGGRAGVGIFRDVRADVILLDMLMPDRDGIQTLCDFRREFPAAAIIAMSASQAPMLAKALELGAKAVLQKPFLIDQLRGTLARVIRQL